MPLLLDHGKAVLECPQLVSRPTLASPPSMRVVPAVLERLRRAGKRLLFVTNNATASRAQYAAKFARLGFPGVGEEQVITPRPRPELFFFEILTPRRLWPSGSTAAQYLVQHHPEVKKVYVMGVHTDLAQLEQCWKQ